MAMLEPAIRTQGAAFRAAPLPVNEPPRADRRLPQLKFICEFIIELAGLADDVGTRPLRRAVPIVGGVVEGQRLHGRLVEPGPGAYAVFSPDAQGSGDAVDLGVEFRTADDALIRVRHFGLRHRPEHVRQAQARGEAIASPQHYLRTHPRFDTDDPRYVWLNSLVAVGSGARGRRHLQLTVYEVI